MTVKIGSARSSYGNTRAGDQSGGREVSTQDWYLHSKGWYVLRAIDPAVREMIAVAMDHACANNAIGYDQSTRNMLWNDVKGRGYDPARTSKAVNVDCSALVRVCCAYAGVMLENFTTPGQKNVMMNSGAFVLFTDADHCKSSRNLLRGDVLVTRTKGHTVVVLSDGSNAKTERICATVTVDAGSALGARNLRNGCTGSDVRELQSALRDLGYDLGSWGADGDFGDCTEIALKCFQRDHGLDVDGVYGKNSHKALTEHLSAIAEETPEAAHAVRIVGGNCYARIGAGTKHKDIGVAKRGECYVFEGAVSADGWYKINFKHQVAWVSGKYAELVSA